MSTPESNHEILVRLENKFDRHMERYQRDQDTRAIQMVDLSKEIERRPTRQEVLSWLGGAGVLSGVLFGLIKLTGAL